jgi:hypothetical protein
MQRKLQETSVTVMDTGEEKEMSVPHPYLDFWKIKF